MMTRTDVLFCWVFTLLGWALMGYSSTIPDHAGGQLFCLIGGMAMVLSAVATMPPFNE